MVSNRSQDMLGGGADCAMLLFLNGNVVCAMMPAPSPLVKLHLHQEGSQMDLVTGLELGLGVESCSLRLLASTQMPGCKAGKAQGHF